MATSLHVLSRMYVVVRFYQAQYTCSHTSQMTIQTCRQETSVGEA